MHRIKFIAVLGILLLLLSACGKTEVTVSFFTMDTFLNMRVYGMSSKRLEILKEEALRLENLFSVTRPDSEIARLNETGLLMDPSPETRDLLEKALQIGRETEGALDVTLYPLVREWGFTTGSYQVPAPERIRQLLDLVDYRRVSLSEAAIRLEEGMALDLGSIAKGYTADYLLARLREEGVTSALLNFGGNVQLIGPRGDGNLWQIAIYNPLDSNTVGILSLADKAIVTSGGYERHFTGEDGQDYWHILDPATGYPARGGLLSVTVVGEEGWRCDALSTALFVMGPEKAREYWQKHRDFDLVLMTEEGRVIITEGLEESFFLTSGQTEIWTLDEN